MHLPSPQEKELLAQILNLNSILQDGITINDNIKNVLKKIGAEYSGSLL
jgi:hypothetical protein